MHPLPAACLHRYTRDRVSPTYSQAAGARVDALFVGNPRSTILMSRCAVSWSSTMIVTVPAQVQKSTWLICAFSQAPVTASPIQVQDRSRPRPALAVAREPYFGVACEPREAPSASRPGRGRHHFAQSTADARSDSDGER